MANDDPQSTAQGTLAGDGAARAADTPPPSSPQQPYAGAFASRGPTTSAAGRLNDPFAPSDHRTYCLIMHLTTILFTALPGISLAAPLVMWQVRKHDSAFIDDHGREVVNFHISMLLYTLASVPLAFLCGIGFAVWVGAIVLCVVGMSMGAAAAYRGEYFRYPMCVRLIR